VFNRGERHEHDAKWEEPLLKQIKHLKEMTMRAKAARAGKRFKHAVTALSVISCEAGQKNLHRSLASMTDVELLAALAAGNFELSLQCSTLRPATLSAAQRAEPASHRPTGRRENQASPLHQQRQASPLDQQQQASPLDHQQGRAGRAGKS
jgi:hypothetical protein